MPNAINYRLQAEAAARWDAAERKHHKPECARNTGHPSWDTCDAGCPPRRDSAGFHLGPDGSRATKRDGMDAYAYRCAICGVVGDIIDGRFSPRREV